MLFSSMTFIFMFLPTVIALYFLARSKYRNYILLLASILFYAWGEPKYVFIMLGTIFINWVGAILIDKHNTYRKPILIGTILADLAILFYFKYFNFIIENINSVAHANLSALDIIMPIGISFYTFQAISYVVDVYRRDVPVQHNVCKLALYICLFPQLIAGPIVKYHDVADQIENRTINTEKIAYGAKRFIVGLAKKMLIANTMGAVADNIFLINPADMGVGVAWIGAIAYSLQLFYDFSGYSDMAIGLGYIFGFRFLENFNYPYISKSITEFWRRWHISLSTWFKEYLYIPLGGNRVSKRRNLMNLGLVFLATGIWHGAAWNFIIWGIWHGFFIIIEKLTGIHKRVGGVAMTAFQHAYTMLAFVVGWVMFRAPDMTYATKYIRVMFGMKHTDMLYKINYFIGSYEILIFVIGIVCAMPIFKNLVLPDDNRKPMYKLALNTYLIGLFIISTAAIAASTYNPFIYFRF